MTHKAVFLDQDGTLVQNAPDNCQTPSTELNDDVVEGLQRLQSYGYLLIIVSNKSGVAHGECKMDASEEMKGSLFNSCARLGIYLDGFYSGEQQHLLRASEDLKIDLKHSWMVGDVLDEAEAGNRAGCKSIGIKSEGETNPANGDYRLPEFFVRNLAEASRFIVAADSTKTDELKVESEKYMLSAQPRQNTAVSGNRILH